MPEDEDFTITYHGKPVTVSPVINKGNIYFIVRLNPNMIIAETLVEETWVWYEAGKGETPLAAELGAIIEDMDV